MEKIFHHTLLNFRVLHDHLSKPIGRECRGNKSGALIDAPEDLAGARKWSGFFSIDFQERIQRTEAGQSGEQRNCAKDDEDNPNPAGYGAGEVQG
jgi:hypothetical protein